MAQMGQIESAKNTVPVGTVALGAPEIVPGPGQFGTVNASRPGSRIQLIGYLDHSLLHPVGFGIQGLKVAPGSAP